MRSRFPVALAAMLLLLAACAPSPPAEGSLTYGLTLAPSGIDPHLNASSELGIPLASVYDTLVVLDPESREFVPGLANDWTISPDGLTYTFRLRRDVTFHDGTRFDAHAVRANIEYTLNPEHHSQKAAFMLGPLDHVETPDDFTAVFVLREPYAPLLDSLSQVYLGMASPAALEKWGPVEYQFHQVGTGPYTFVEYVPNDHLTLQANPAYNWGPSVYRQRRASIQTITFRFFTDPATRALALESEQADIVGEIPPRDAERLAASGKFSLLPVAIPGQPLQLLLNTQRAPTDELAVRQALLLAADRASIVRTLFGDTSPVAQGPLSLNLMPFLNEEPLPGNQPDEAARLLDNAGWTLADGKPPRARDGQPLQLRVVAPSWGSNPEVAQLLQAQWEQLGIQVDVEIAAAFGPLKEAQAAGDYNLIGVNLFGTDPDLLRPFFSTGGTYDWTMVHSDNLDRLLLQASGTTDGRSRAAMYEQIARIIRDQALVLPIRDYVNLVVARAGVLDLRFSAQGWFPYLIDLRLAS